RLRHAARWGACASARPAHTVRVDERRTQRGHGESPSARAAATVREGGLCQCGHTKDDRAAVPQVKVMQAVLDPWGTPLATDVVSGERADAPRSLPGSARGPARVGRRGL